MGIDGRARFKWYMLVALSTVLFVLMGLRIYSYG